MRQESLALKHLLSQAFSHEGCAANFTALLIFLFLKRSEGRGENEHSIQLKRRKNKCIGQICVGTAFYMLFKEKGRDGKRGRKK
jgi:hypothetical protein